MNWSRSTCRTQYPTLLSLAEPGQAAPAGSRSWPGARGMRPGPTVATWRRRAVPVPAAAAWARARRRSGLPGQDDLVPDPAGEVEPVALVHPGGGVADVGVQRVPVPGGLLGPVGPGDHAERASHAGTGAGRPGHGRP